LYRTGAILRLERAGCGLSAFGVAATLIVQKSVTSRRMPESFEISFWRYFARLGEA